MAQFTLDGVTYSRFRDIPGAVYTRSGVEYQQNAAGVWVPFDDDVPPVSAGVGVDVWQGATNLALQSQTFSGWPGNASGVTTNAIVAPDGTLTGAKLRSANSSVYQSLFYQPTFAAGGATITRSIYAKAGEYSWAYLQQYDGTTNRGAYFNLATGQVGNVETGVTASITPASGGWYRLSVTFSAAPGATYERVQISLVQSNGGSPVFTGDGASGFYIWGGQLEAVSVATPYIPTTNAAATRGNPSMYINAPGLLVPPFTVQVWAQLPALDGVARALVQIDDGSNTNRIFLQRSSGNAASMGTAGGSGGVPTAFSGKTGARLLKMAARVRSTELALACDGAAPNSASGVTLPPNLSRVLLGGNASAQFYPNGAIQRFQIINRDVTDAELQALAA